MAARRAVRGAAVFLLLGLSACQDQERSPTEPVSSAAQQAPVGRRPSIRTIAPRRPIPAPVVTPTGGYIIRGTVTDASTRQPIRGADVRLIDFNLGATMRSGQRTNSSGQFLFLTTYCDTCFLLAGHPDYYGPAQAFAGTRSAVTVVDFQLSHR